MDLNALSSDGKVKTPFTYLITKVFLLKGLLLLFFTLAEGQKAAMPIYKILYWQPIAGLVVISLALVAIICHLSYVLKDKVDSKFFSGVWKHQFSILKWALVVDVLALASALALNGRTTELNIFVTAAAVYLFTSWYNNEVLKTFFVTWKEKEA